MRYLVTITSFHHRPLVPIVIYSEGFRSLRAAVAIALARADEESERDWSHAPGRGFVATVSDAERPRGDNLVFATGLAYGD